MTNAAYALLSLFSISVLLIIVLLVKEYLIDSFRQKIFAVRAELFDEGLKGNIDFNSDAYKMARQTMNGIIRFAHKMSLINLIVTIYLNNKADAQASKKFTTSLSKAMDKLDQEQQHIIENALKKTNKEVVSFLKKRSPFTYVCSTLIVSAVGELNAKEKVVSGFDAVSYKEGYA